MARRRSLFQLIRLCWHRESHIPLWPKLIFSLGVGLLLLGCRARTPASPQPTFSARSIATTTTTGPLIPQSIPTVTGGPERLIGTYVPPLQFTQYCEQMSNYGARFTWVAIPWDAIEPSQGTFVWRRADPILQAMHNCGFDIGVHILSRHAGGWATLPTPNIPNQKNASMPPKDLNAYYNFVYQLASHYKGIVSRYSIENEAHASSNWPSSPESYFQVLATAYKAIKAADPNALVEDAALSSSSLGVLIANDMLKAGKTQEAVDFLNRYYATYAPRSRGGEPIVVDKEQDLQDLLAMPEVQRLLAWAPMLFANHAYYDVEQLHYFGPWEDLPMVMSWVHDKLKAQGDDKPLDLWEMGYAWTNVNTYDPQAHARDEPKYLATALGEGGLRAVSWLFTDFAFQAEGHPGLTTAQGPRPAAESFRVTADKLNGTTNSARLDLGEGIWGYRFDKPSGSVYVVWSTDARKVSLPIEAQTVIVTDITGQTMTADPKTLGVSDSPIFVESR